MLKSSEVEKKSIVKINRWVDVDSKEFKEMSSPAEIILTKKVVKAISFKDSGISTDELGRIWSKNEDGSFWPLHSEIGKEIIGFKVSKMAAN
jgi:hypothetical protein